MNKLYASRPRKLCAALFTLIETLLISFIVFGVGNATVNCYSAVVLAFLVSIPFLFENKKENGLITCALFFTVVADFFFDEHPPNPITSEVTNNNTGKTDLFFIKSSSFTS